MGSLSDWVSDNLHDIVGFTERQMVDFVIAIAKKNTKLDEFLESLKACDVPITPKTEEFAKELLAKIPRQQQQPSRAQLEEQQKIDYLKKNESYTLVLDQDADTESLPKIRKEP